MKHLEDRQHVLPRNLNRQFRAKPRQKLASIHRDKNLDWANPQNRIKYMNIPPKRRDIDIQMQRSQTLVHPAKVSGDSPQWWKSTDKYLKRTQMPKLQHTIDLHGCSNDQKQFDVFNRKKDSYMMIRNARQQSIYNNRSASFNMYDSRVCSPGSQNSYNSLSFRNNKSEISPKVGSIQYRDYSIKKPQLKIGSNNYIDTYSVF